MTCVSDDGKPTLSGIRLLHAIKSGSEDPDSIAREAELPLYRIRSGLRKMLQFGLVTKINESTYRITEKGREW